MISQMDQVYANATLTIIDASGGNSQRGLPGVSKFSRRLQNFVHIQNTTLLELPGGDHELNFSTWATRGWTYQEGFFSTRRLIFAPSQVLFLCNESFEEESIHRFLQHDESAHMTGTERFRHLIPQFSVDAHISSRQSLLEQLAEYSRRDLTYQSDSLNAFHGVLNSYAHNSHPFARTFLHVGWGLFVRKLENNHPELSEKNELRVYLNWYHEATAARRPNFPTWAWAGWGGPLTLEDEGIKLLKCGSDSQLLSHLDWNICWVSDDHKSVNILDLANDLLNAKYTDQFQRYQQPTYLKHLHITCLVLPMHLRKTPLKDSQRSQATYFQFENEPGSIKFEHLSSPKENMAVVQLCEGIYIAAPPYLDQDVHMKDSFSGLIFARRSSDRSLFSEEGVDTSLTSSFGCLIARKLGEGVYERVGAVPRLLHYSRNASRHYLSLLQLLFLDAAGSVLDQVRIPARQMELPFDGIGQRRTILLK